MITALIIDDEAKGRLALRQKITGYCPQISIQGEAENGWDALEMIKSCKPQLIFLDIDMPKMNGFEMLNNVTEKNFHVIFTTAYDQYAITAIKYAAFDYLLKPVDIEELKAAVARISAAGNNHTRKQAELLNQNLQKPRNKLQKLAIPTLDGLHFYELGDIIYLEANSNYTNIYFSGNGKVTASKTLKEFEDLLPQEQFFRTHHSFIINLHYIKRYIKGDGGQIELLNGVLVDVSRRKKDEFLKIIGY